jgi:hypothetical protein
MFPVTPRFDPKSVFPYVCKSDKGNTDFTTFLLKPLTILQYRECSETSYSNGINKIGSMAIAVLKHGLIGWDNFKFDGDQEPIEFSYENISAIPSDEQLELYGQILQLTEPEQELLYEIKFVAKWSSALSKLDNSDQWDCEFCSDKKLNEARNCDGSIPNECNRCGNKTLETICPKCKAKTRPKFKFMFSKQIGDHVTQCPVSLLTIRAIKLTNMINYMNDLNSLPVPGGALEQTNYFYEIRSAVMSERDAILRKEMKDSEHGN